MRLACSPAKEADDEEKSFQRKAGQRGLQGELGHKLNVIECSACVEPETSARAALQSPAMGGPARAPALPDVFVPQWPEDPCDYVATLRKLSCFSVVDVSHEDRNRAELFQQEKQRTDLMRTICDRKTWLESLQMQLKIETVHDGNMARVVQLLNKTNQFNLHTRRMTQGELERWLGDGNALLAFRVSDRFGDMGLIGLLGLQSSEAGTEISDLVMSCRVMGRDIEKAMLQTALRYAQDAGHDRVRISYEPTKKNRPVFDFLKTIELITDDAHAGWLTPENGRFDLKFFGAAD